MKIVLVGSSNGKSKHAWPRIQALQQQLLTLSRVEKVQISRSIFQSSQTGQTLPAEERAQLLMEVFNDPSVSVVLDISGGDACNEVLPYLDWKTLKSCHQRFFGYSDVSVLLNVLSERTSMQVYNFNAMTMIGEKGKQQLALFAEILERPDAILTPLQRVLHQGERIRGGNLRCTLKLAGTEYFPNTIDSVFLIESMSGNLDRIKSYVTHLEQIGVFANCKAILVGQFQEVEEDGMKEALLSYIKEKAFRYKIEVRETPMIGHGVDTVPVPYRTPQ